MATSVRQSEFRRYLPALFSFALIALAGFARADDIGPSGRTAFVGDAFYLLTETTFGSAELAKVRLEVPGGKASLEGYSGIDVRTYRVPDPIAFLKKQKNLHRPILKGEYAGEGVSNVLDYLWDSWFKKSRLAWQRIFSFSTRKRAVEYAPELQQTTPHAYRTRFVNDIQFKPLPGLEVVDTFRYPLWQAKPVEPPKGVALEGSSSAFRAPGEGNIQLPIGKLKPGLYLVEGMIGTFRASTFVFVSDTVAITKLSSKQELIWTVDKKSGKPAPETRIVLTDGVGTLAEGRTAKDGVYVSEGKNLERSYAFGLDKSGGVFISENFYYDSEVYGTKLYVFTDRPLYRPGDEVFLKLLGREFRSSRESDALKAVNADVSVEDANGTPIFAGKFAIAAGISGGDLGFRLPEEAGAGGYSIKVFVDGTTYLSAFRVANYVKPHFEIDVGFSKRDYKVGEEIKSTIRLNYPSGEPVKDAAVVVEVRRQRLTIVGGELQYLDRFPVRLSQENVRSNANGKVELTLPAATEPSRLVIQLRATDGASFRVASTKELLVQAGGSALELRGARNYTAPKERAEFTIAPGRAGEAGDMVRQPAGWNAIRLEDRAVTNGKLNPGARDFEISFERAGSYTVNLVDDAGIVLGSANHWVQGPELAGVPGTISILTDQDSYEPGKVAKLRVTFSESVEESLVTLERDRVEKFSLASENGDFMKLKRISDREFAGEFPILETYSPNVTLSFAYVAHGQFYFENKGVKVARPEIELSFHPEKPVYLPGERVNVNVTATWRGEPIEALVALGVVDEMIYVLQPEIAPNISDFFYHPRRNQVRTSSSLEFHAYDVATSATGAKPSGGRDAEHYGDRSLKLRERPRREEKDTAYWNPSLKTDAKGKAKFSFLMPDSLTRWRITGRAIAANGAVGQRKDFVQSQKDVYAKWTGPTKYRRGDATDVSVALFNLTDQERKVEVDAIGPGLKEKKNLGLPPGATYLVLPLKAETGGEVDVAIREGNTVLDRVTTTLSTVSTVSTGWASRRTAVGGTIPKDATAIRATAAVGAGTLFLGATGDLLEYPYGCVEQTSSRLLPLALAYSSILDGDSRKLRDELRDRIASERLRLIRMAGPEAHFAWWGNIADTSAFMTTYAYFTDHFAAKAIGITLPAKQSETLQAAYPKTWESETISNQSAMLWMNAQMGLPVKTLLGGALERAQKEFSAAEFEVGELFSEDRRGERLAAAMLLDQLANRYGPAVPSAVASAAKDAREKAPGSGSTLAASVYLLGKKGSLSGDDRALAEKTLAALGPESPTIRRGLTLAFLHEALGGFLKEDRSPNPGPGKNWVRKDSRLGRPIWEFHGVAPPTAIPEGYRVTYSSAADEVSNLGVTVERTFYRVVPSGEATEAGTPFKLEPMDEKDGFKTTELYLDQVVVSPPAGKTVKYGFLEASLPPGGEVETTTWGILLKDDAGNALQAGSPSFQSGDLSYGSGLDLLSAPVTFRHLVRFAQAGTYRLPPARFFRMYLESEKSYEGGKSSAIRTLRVR